MNTPTAPATAQCIGRFAFTLPAGWAVAGRQQKMYFTTLDDALPPAAPGLSEADRTLAWLHQGLPPKAPLIRQFTLEGLGPAAWFGLGSADSVDRRLVALAGPPATPLRMEAMATKGREAIAEKGLRMIAAGYRPGARTGFCLSGGAMQLDPSRNETTELVAENAQLPDARLTFATQAVAKPDETTTDSSAEIANAAGLGAKLRILHQGPRMVAGLAGHELLGELTRPGAASRLIFRFAFAGKPRQATEPSMTVMLQGPATQQAALDAAWQGMLGSLQPVPPR